MFSNSSTIYVNNKKYRALRIFEKFYDKYCSYLIPDAKKGEFIGKDVRAVIN